ncbi:MAG TPA: hypothetical protein VHH34_24825 [Pseudonocardiaceae bacterium]|nr:hypothetical protein [Pseudonocardiaceae bacterium]
MSTPTAAELRLARVQAGHPPWCSAEHCYVCEPTGVRVHVQEPVQWEAPSEARFETRLWHCGEETEPRVELSVTSLVLPARGVDLMLPLAAARRLRDQLTDRLDWAGDEPDVAAAVTALIDSGVVQHGRCTEALESAGAVRARRRHGGASWLSRVLLGRFPTR